MRVQRPQASGGWGPGKAGPSPAHQHTLRARLRYLYNSGAEDAVRFRYALLALDTVSVAWIVATSFLRPGPVVWTLDILLGLILLAEFVARFAATHRPFREAVRLVSLADLVAILSLILAPLLPHSAAFLRALRLLRLVRSPRVLAQLRADIPDFRRNEDALVAATDLAVFLFVMTAAVYESQHLLNSAIRNYGDALYFTVTALTTTGFGDIVPRDTFGRLLTVVIMLAGVTLFLRLAQALFRPAKVRFPCPTCGLQRHEPDAVHCKACGTILNIPDEGDD